MRILQITLHYWAAGGLERYVDDVSASLEQQGHHVAILHASAGAQTPDVDGRPTYHAPGLLYHMPGDDAQMRERTRAVLAQARPDIVYAHIPPHPSVADELRRRVPTVFFHHTHDLYCPAGTRLLQRSDRICTHEAGPGCFLRAFTEQCVTRHPLKLEPLLRVVERRAAWAREIDGVVVGSHYMRDELLARGFHPERVHALHYPVPLPTLPALRPPREPIVLFAGRIVPQKGLDYLIEAMRRVPGPARLVVAGDGYEAAAAKQLTARLGLADRVVFLGATPRAALAELYERAAVFVAPSVWPEPFGIVGPEAMSYELPVIAFGVGGIPEWLIDGETGFVVESRDVAGLARQIKRLLAEPDLARRLGERGRAVVRERFTLDHHVERLVALFERLIAARAAGRPDDIGAAFPAASGAGRGWA